MGNLFASTHDSGYRFYIDPNHNPHLRGQNGAADWSVGSERKILSPNKNAYLGRGVSKSRGDKIIPHPIQVETVNDTSDSPRTTEPDSNVLPTVIASILPDDAGTTIVQGTVVEIYSLAEAAEHNEIPLATLRTGVENFRSLVDIEPDLLETHSICAPTRRGRPMDSSFRSIWRDLYNCFKC